MISRLVLGWDWPLQPLISYAQSVSGTVHVLTETPDRFESLQSVDLTIHTGDPTNATAIEALGHVHITLIASSSPHKAQGMATAARRALPATHLLLVDIDGTHRRNEHQLATVVDEIIDPNEQIVQTLESLTTSPLAIRSYRVRHVLRDLPGELGVYMHDNPDPDAIASAIAVVTLAESLGVPAKAYYYGDITHQSNRAFVNLLDIEFTHLDASEPPPETAGIALVDHSLPGVNNSLPSDTPVDLIFDHHTPSGPVEARFVDLRESVGATSSILIEYLTQFDIPIDTTLATALLFGIQTDTRNLTRAVTPVDFFGAKTVLPVADQDLLRRVESPSMSQETMNTLAQSIRSRRVRGPVAVANAGEISERDSLAQAAELLLQIEDIGVTLVYGLSDDVIHASARARMPGSPIDLATVMRDAYGQIGSAGGHEEMAGASIPLGVMAFTDTGESEYPEEEVRHLLENRFLDAVWTQFRRRADNGERF